LYVFLKCCNDGKLVKTVDGADREDRLAAHETVRNAYARRNLLVWRYMIRSIDKHCRTSKAVRLMIIDDFREDHDGYELIQYLNVYASERSDIDVDKLRTRIEKMSFKTSESPARWALTVQLLRQWWLDIPEDQRGGGDKQLISLLLKKVGAACQNYVSYVRAGTATPLSVIRTWSSDRSVMRRSTWHTFSCPLLALPPQWTTGVERGFAFGPVPVVISVVVPQRWRRRRGAMVWA
tara:strand:+ start:1269 stop:1976 length:708 start_codon:yes stop_codon:yes gene_type:complete